jgi:hypothetical protein
MATDKERILMSIIHQLSVTNTLGPYHQNWSQGSAAYQQDGREGAFVHFAPWDGSRLKPGMLVLCKTSVAREVHDWAVAYVVEVLGDAECMLREIGSDRLLRMGNESFEPIVGMPEHMLREREQHQFAKKVQAAFRRGGEYSYRYGGIDFDASNAGRATVWVREVFGGMNKPSRPFAVAMEYTRKTTTKAILEEMRKQGYGTRAFEIDEEEVERRRLEAEKRK